MTTKTLDSESSTSEVGAAEAVDAALSARQCGVPDGEAETAFGHEAVRLAALAERMADDGFRQPLAPDTGFVRGLEARVAEAFDARPVEARWPWSALRIGGFGELVVVTTVAAVVATIAFLMGAGSLIDGQSTPVPTVKAATETATVVPPSARAGVGSDADGQADADATSSAVDAIDSWAAREPVGERRSDAVNGGSRPAPRSRPTPHAANVYPPLPSIPSIAAPTTAPQPARRPSRRA